MPESRLNNHTKFFVFGYQDFCGDTDEIRMRSVARFTSILEHIFGSLNVRCVHVRQTDSCIFELDSSQKRHHRIYQDLIAWASCHPSAELLRHVASRFVADESGLTKAA